MGNRGADDTDAEVESWRRSKLGKRVKVVEKSTTTPTTTTSPSETTALSTTTATPVMTNASKKDNLALTGASPLGFPALGALLLAAGLSAFFVARS